MTDPTHLPKPLLKDPLNERELFADEIAAIGAIHGNIWIGAFARTELGFGPWPFLTRCTTMIAILSATPRSTGHYRPSSGSGTPDTK